MQQQQKTMGRIQCMAAHSTPSGTGNGRSKSLENKLS